MRHIPILHMELPGVKVPKFPLWSQCIKAVTDVADDEDVRCTITMRAISEGRIGAFRADGRIDNR